MDHIPAGGPGLTLKQLGLQDRKSPLAHMAIRHVVETEHLMPRVTGEVRRFPGGRCAFPHPPKPSRTCMCTHMQEPANGCLREQSLRDEDSRASSQSPEENSLCLVSPESTW